MKLRKEKMTVTTRTRWNSEQMYFGSRGDTVKEVKVHDYDRGLMYVLMCKPNTTNAAIRARFRAEGLKINENAPVYMA